MSVNILDFIQGFNEMLSDSQWCSYIFSEWDVFNQYYIKNIQYGAI